MATQVPPVRGATFYFEVSLVSQSDTDTFQNNPTLASGDVVVYKDGALDGNIDTLPTAIGAGRVVLVTLSTDEMTADRVTVLFHDAAGDEWQDLLVTIHTSAQTLNTIDTNVDAILSDTGTDGVVLANDAITSAKFDESSAYPLTAADSGSTYVARTGADGDTLETLSDEIAALNDLSAAQVNAQVVDALATDTYAEPGQGAPSATTSLAAKLGYLYKAWRNRKTATSTTATLYADNGTTTDQAATISDDGTTFTYGEWGTGA